jgi:2,3-bisphosphoglycerate-independent phosphoglycerate mutase
MTDFGPDLQVHTAFPGKTIQATIPMVLGNIRQLYTAESEKYAHVTYFLNGGYADPVDKEDRIMIPSPDTDNFAKVPEMSAEILNQNIINNLKHDIYDFVTVNFANADIVGHTGDLKAVVRAIEFLDRQLKDLAGIVREKKGQMLITADHGNADDMIDAGTNQPNTFHTKNPVPFIVMSEKLKDKKLQDGGVLGNIAPTLLEIMEIEKPKAMKCESLIA